VYIRPSLQAVIVATQWLLASYQHHFMAAAILLQSNMFWHLEGALYNTLWPKQLVSPHNASVIIIIMRGYVFTPSTVMIA